MKKWIVFIIFIICHFVAGAQPGCHKINKNLNDYSDAEIKLSKETPKYAYYRYSYIIDSTTDFSRLYNLRSLDHITIVADIKSLPKEIYFLADSLTDLTLECSDKLLDLSAINQLKNLKSIIIENYIGVGLPALNQLTKLKSLRIVADFYKGDSLQHISSLGDCKELQVLDIRNSNLKKLDLDMSRMNLKQLSLDACRSLKNIDAITSSNSLRELSLTEIPIEKLPVHMNKMENLDTLYLTETEELEDISSLNSMKNLQMVSISISNIRLTEIPPAFNTNHAISDLNIEVVHGTSLKSAAGLSQLKNLKSIKLSFAKFILPTDFNTCENLEDIEFVGLDSLNISRLSNLNNLKKISFCSCSFSKLPENIYTDKNIEEVTVAYNHLIYDLSDITKFKKIRGFTIIGNNNLLKIPDFGSQISSFDRLFIKDNKNLILPESYKSMVNKFGYIDLKRDNIN